MKIARVGLFVSLFLILCACFAYADVIGHVTVTWDELVSPYYNGPIVCIEDTSIFGPFEQILIEENVRCVRDGSCG